MNMFAQRTLVVALLAAAQGVTCPMAHAAFIEIQPGETVSQIVNRLVPDDPLRFQQALRTVMALNRARFPYGRAELVGAGFQLEVPASMRAEPIKKRTPQVSASGRDHYIAKANDTLQSIAEQLFPETPGAIENAIADLARINAHVNGVSAARPEQRLRVGTTLALPAWVVTATTTLLPNKFEKGALAAGIFVPVVSPPSQPATLLADSQPATAAFAVRNADGSTTHTEFENTRVALVAAATSVSLSSGPFPKAPATDAEEVRTASVTGETVIAQVTTLDRVEAEQERLRKLMAGKPKAYEDRVMDPNSVPAQRNDDTTTLNTDAEGFRAYLGEARIGHAQNNSGASATEYGLRGEYRQETLNYGEYVAQADVRSRQGDPTTSIGTLGSANQKNSARITLRNLGFPLTTQIFADTALGDQASQLTDAFGRSYRASLGSSTVRGVSTHILAREFDARFGIGERGGLVGGPYPGFEKTQGLLAWGGYTQRFGTDAFVGGQINHATDMPLYGSGLGIGSGIANGISTVPGTNVTSAAVALGYGSDLVDAGASRARISLVSSNSSSASFGQKKSAFGAFVEGGFRSGDYRHELGTFWAQPNLRFGDSVMTSDNRGAYWRVDHRGTRLNWGLGADFEETNPSRAAERLAQRRIGLNGNAQYRVDRQTTVGGNMSLADTRYQNSDAYSVTGDGNRSYNASLFYQTLFYDWGRSRVTVTARQNETLVANSVKATGQELQWEHDWITGKYETMRPEFTTTLGYARDVSDNKTQTYPTAGLLWKYWPDADWSFGGNLRYTSRTGNLATSRGLSGSVNTEKVFNNGWRIGLQASINQARVDVTGPQPVVTRSNDKSVFLYVRFEGSSGTPFQSLGLRARNSAGGGSISGQVFYDANRDGEQQADELGAPNVEVVLDGRYRTTTDRDGRFEFPIVPTGDHRLTLVLETVPLPWGVALERGREVNVPLRGQVTTKIPVVKVGE